MPTSRKEYLQAELALSHSLALKWHASILTGSCKERKTQRGVEGGGWRDLTDEEKIKDAEQILGRHVARVMELTDLLGREK